MGGELEIWSEPGHGCRASIRLPVHTSPVSEVDLSSPLVEGAEAAPA